MGTHISPTQVRPSLRVCGESELDAWCGTDIFSLQVLPGQLQSLQADRWPGSGLHKKLGG